MGRVKLKIKRLESTSSRQVTYSKRRSGILKKANELSILCDIDILLLMFSPNGRPTLFHGERSNIEEVVAKFAQLTPQERAKRKLESLEALKKTFKKLDHDVHIQEFLGGSTQTVEELTNQVRHLQARITEIHQRLSSWCNLDKIDNAEHLRQMEDVLRQSLQRIRLHKESLMKHQLMSLDTSSQFQNGIQPPLMIGGMQEIQPLSWLPIPNNQPMILQDGSNFLPQTNIECSTDASFPGLGGYYETGKQPETDGSGQINSSKQDSSGLTELGTSGCMSLHLTEQYSYPFYNSANLQNEEKLKPESEMKLQGIPMEYQFNGNFALPRSIYDHGHHLWAPPSAPCVLTTFDGNPYQQQPH